MDIKKRKLKGYVALSVLIIACLIMASAMTFFGMSKDANVLAAMASSYAEVDELLISGYENKPQNSKIFNGDSLADLFYKLTGDKNATISTVSALSTKDSSYFRSRNDGKDITVMLGGKKWTATYLTQASGDVILDLWLLDGSVTDVWNNNYVNSGAGTYPHNMYGMSRMRSVTLNHGGTYVNNDDQITTASFTQVTDSPFAIYTVPYSENYKASIRDFIVQPQNVAYQATENSSGIAANLTTSECDHTRNNEAYNKITSGANWANTNYCYENKTNYSMWKTDYIWLPSIAELGNTDGENGIWKASMAQRAFRCWTRSARELNSGGVYVVSSSTAYYGSTPVTDGTVAVCPAFHLNLSKVAKAATPANPSYKITSENKEDNIKYYNDGNDVTFELRNAIEEDLVDVESITATDMDGNAMTYSGTSSFAGGVISFKVQKVGTYTVTVKPKTGQYWADGTTDEKTCTYTLKYKLTPLAWKTASTNTVTYNGKDQYLELINYDEDVGKLITVEPATSDMFGKIPSGQPNSGNWAIKVKDYIDKTTDADKAKIRVELKNTSFMVWDDLTTGAKTLDFTVNKKNLIVTSNDTSWETQVNTNDTTYDVLIDGLIADDLDIISFVGFYKKGSGSEQEVSIAPDFAKTGSNYEMADGKYKVTVTLPEIADDGAYRYILKLASSVKNYSLTYEKDFDVEKKSVNLQEDDIVWLYKNYSSTGNEYIEVDKTKLDTDKIFNVTYNGEAYTFKVDTDSATSKLKKYANDVEYTIIEESSATDVKWNGSNVTNYTVKLKITARAGVTGLDIKTSEFTLKWKIKQALFDLTDVKWDYTNPLPFNNATQTVKLQLPNGLEVATCVGNSGKNVKQYYSANVTALKFTDSNMSKNYVLPTVNGKGTTYIFDGSGDVPWTLQWEITVGPLALEWKVVDTHKDGNGRRFKYAQVKDEYKDYISGYKYYTEDDYNDGCPAGSEKTLDDIIVVAEQVDTYYAVAILASGWAGSFEITTTTQAHVFTVGSLKTEIFIEMTQRNHTYDGQKFGDGWDIIRDAGSLPINRNVVKDTYYSIASDGTRTLLTDGVPKDAGKYVVAFSFRDPDDASEYEMVIEEIEFEIEQAEIEIALSKNEYTYDGQGKGGEFVVSTGNYNVSDLLKTYYKGNTKDFPLSTGELPCDTGKYIVELSLPNGETNYKIKSGCE
ncbi:MAG: hypothetical protein HDT29_03440 [Clostridiales bacterium]|nr:hypothetical protein [Clostridiales bacterium]